MQKITMQECKDTFKKPLIRALAGITSLSVLLLIPLYVIHAQSLTFSHDSDGNWQYSSPYADGPTYAMFVAPDGSGSAGWFPSKYIDTSEPSSVPLEAFVADTKGDVFSAACNSPTYTGDPATDFSCYAQAATDQGFAYTLGIRSSSQSPTDTGSNPATKPCNCP